MPPSDWQNPSETICLECASCHNPEKMNFMNNYSEKIRCSQVAQPINMALQCLQTVNPAVLYSVYIASYFLCAIHIIHS